MVFAGGVIIPISSVMTPSEAAERWGLKRNTIIAALNRGLFDEQIKKGLVRQHQYENGKSDWYLTEQALREVYGDQNSQKKTQSEKYFADEPKWGGKNKRRNKK